MCRSFCVYLLALFFYNFVDCPYFIAKCFAISCVIVCVRAYMRSTQVYRKSFRLLSKWTQFFFWQSFRAFAICTHIERERDASSSFMSHFLSLCLTVSVLFKTFIHSCFSCWHCYRPLQIWKKEQRQRISEITHFFALLLFDFSISYLYLFLFVVFFLYFLPFVISDVLKWESLIKGRCGKRIVYNNTIHGKLYKYSINKIKYDGDGDGGGDGVYMPSGVEYQRVFMYDILHLQGKARQGAA